MMTPRLVTQIDRHALALREALEHSLERVLAPQPALFEPAVRLAHDLAETLIDLDPACVDRVRGTKRAADVLAPDVRREAVVGVVRHAHRIGGVIPWDRDEDRAKDLLAGDSPIVPYVREDRWLHVIALGQPALLRRHASDHRPRALLMRTLVDETRDAVELLPAHDRAHVVLLVERIADLEFAQLRR